MKILHTSDWHVGKTLRGRSRIAEHEAVLQQMTELAARETVDLVLVVGDLFDSAAPGPDAERLVYKTLLGLSQAGAQVAIVAGNHDNERRLQAVQPLLELGSVVARAVPADGCVDLTTKTGERARLALLPWVGKHHIVRAEQLMNLDAAETQQLYAERVARIVARLCEPMGGDTVNLLAAHLAMPLDDPGEDVRQAHIMDYVVPATIFPSSLHYVALGHYHRPIEVFGPAPIRYCGSPLWLGFPRMEHENDDKGVFIVEASAGTPAEIRFEPLGGGRRLRTLRGTLKELESMSGSFGDDYLRIFVREQARAGIAQQVHEWFPEAVDVRIDPSLAGMDDDEPKPRRSGRAPGALFRDYLTERNANDERVVALFDSLLEEAYAPDPA